MLNSFHTYAVYADVATDAYATVNFTFKSRAVEISAINQAIEICFMLPDGTFGDPILYDPFAMAFPFGPVPWQTMGFQVRNAIAGINGSYQVVEYV
jgi:hypothetical protein